MSTARWTSVVTLTDVSAAELPAERGVRRDPIGQRDPEPGSILRSHRAEQSPAPSELPSIPQGDDPMLFIVATELIANSLPLGQCGSVSVLRSARVRISESQRRLPGDHSARRIDRIRPSATVDPRHRKGRFLTRSGSRDRPLFGTSIRRSPHSEFQGLTVGAMRIVVHYG